jgi:hypothetical protein
MTITMVMLMMMMLMMMLMMMMMMLNCRSCQTLVCQSTSAIPFDPIHPLLNPILELNIMLVVQLVKCVTADCTTAI